MKRIGINKSHKLLWGALRTFCLWYLKEIHFDWNCLVMTDVIKVPPCCIYTHLHLLAWLQSWGGEPIHSDKQACHLPRKRWPLLRKTRKEKSTCLSSLRSVKAQIQTQLHSCLLTIGNLDELNGINLCDLAFNFDCVSQELSPIDEPPFGDHLPFLLILIHSWCRLYLGTALNHFLYVRIIVAKMSLRKA